MILTVTPNTALDHTVWVPRLGRNETVRSDASEISLAGKGVVTSWALAELGVANRASGFVAGDSGRRIVDGLSARGVQTDFVDAGGETRTNLILIAADGSHVTYSRDTLRVDPAVHVPVLLATVTQNCAYAKFMTVGGSLPSGAPADLYAVLVQVARARRVPVVLDASGDPLRRGVAAQPDWIKPNQQELAALTDRPIHTLADGYAAAQHLFDTCGTQVLATFGAHGALAISREGPFFAPALNLDVVNPVGAGDAYVAGLAAGLARGDSLPDALRLGAACAAAATLQRGTAALSRHDVENLAPLVRINPIVQPQRFLIDRASIMLDS